MTIEKKPEAVDNIVIDLDGPNGNAFYLLGVANNLCKQVGLDFAPIEKKMSFVQGKGLCGMAQNTFFGRIAVC